LKLFFDATFGSGWVGYLRNFFLIHKEPRPKFVHIYDIFEPGVKDDVWIPQTIQMDCVIITADRGRAQPRLPEICKKNNKTHILLSPTMHKKATDFQRARAIIVLWPQLTKAFVSPKGSRFQIQATDSSCEHFRLEQKS
jgi:hypothetical protein